MTEQKYISLIVKDCNNELNKTEQKALGSWIDADVKHKKLYAEIKDDWEKSAAYKSELVIDKAKAWQKIESKISAAQETKVVSIFKYKQLFRIVAMLVVVFTATFFVKDFVLNKGFVTEQTAENETKSINLPDGSTVVLNENSSLRYKDIFSKREVSLKGEAFFEVTKDENHPFTVNVNKTTTQVLGTSFNIDAQQKGIIELALITGKVKFSNTKNNSVILNPGETATYNKQTAIFTKKKNNNENSISWKTNKLVFDNTNLIEVVKNLNDYYKSKISLKETQNTACTFTGTFENAKLEEVLEVLSFSLNTELEFVNNNYSIGAGDCQ